MWQVNDCLATAASGEVGGDLFYCHLVEDLRNLWKKEESLFFPAAVSFSQMFWETVSPLEILQVASVPAALDEVKDISGTTISAGDRFHLLVQTSDNVWWFNRLGDCAVISFSLHKKHSRSSETHYQWDGAAFKILLLSFHCRPRRQIICFSLLQQKMETELSAHWLGKTTASYLLAG